MTRTRAVLLSCGLVVLTLAVYAQAFDFGFVAYDDKVYVTANPRVLAGFSGSGLAWAMTATTAANWHPITWMSLMLDVSMGGVDPKVFHRTNVLLHLVNVLLLFYVLSFLTGAVLRSAFIAGLFAVHPLHVESVAWIAERKDVLSTSFWLLAMLAYAWHARRPSVGRYALVLVAFAAGLMCKPMVITLPVVLLLLDFWPLGRLHGPWHRLVAGKVPFLLLAAASALATLYAQERGGAVGLLERFPISMRAANAVVAYTSYLAKTFWPTALAIPYPYDLSALTYGRIAVSVAILATVSALAVRWAKSRSYLLFGWLWYLVTLLPVIGLVQVGEQALADRYTYVPLIGIFVMLAWGIADILLRTPLSGRMTAPALAASAIVVLVILAIRAHSQAGVWRDTTSLFSNTLRVSPVNATAHNGLGVELQGRGQFERAIVEYRAALRAAPWRSNVRKNLAGALVQAGRPAEAIPMCSEALALDPNDSSAHGCLGFAKLHLGDLDAAITHLERALALDPGNLAAHVNLAMAHAGRGRIDEAVTELVEAARLHPLDLWTPGELGNALSEARRPRACRGVLPERAPDRAEERDSAPEPRGSAGATGRINDAIVLFREALVIEPEDEGTRRNLERALALAAEPAR